MYRKYSCTLCVVIITYYYVLGLCIFLLLCFSLQMSLLTIKQMVNQGCAAYCVIYRGILGNLLLKLYYSIKPICHLQLGLLHKYFGKHNPGVLL